MPCPSWGHHGLSSSSYPSLCSCYGHRSIQGTHPYISFHGLFYIPPPSLGYCDCYSSGKTDDVLGLKSPILAVN